MSDTPTVSVKPIVRYPREAQVGKTYLMTIDLEVEEGFEWQYEEEEYPIYCQVNSKVFSSKPVGEPVIVLHRFGGSYGEAKFLLTAIQLEEEKGIQVILANRWGVLIKSIRLNEVKVTRNSPSLLDKIGTLKVNSTISISILDLQRYQEALLERYGNLTLKILDTAGFFYNELKLWQMFIPQNVRECREYLPQVYELPKYFQRRLAERGELEPELTLQQLERHQKSYREQPVYSVLDRLKDSRYPYLAILGDPGSGKSTLLQSIALEWAEKPLVELPLHPIPILIQLRAYVRDRASGNCQDFLDFIHQSSGCVNYLNPHQLAEELKAGNAIALFDGLDEVFDRAQRKDVISQIHNFTQQYEKVRVIVTSRVTGYKAQRLRDAGFSHFMLQDLDEGQIEDFIQRWHERTYQNEGERNRKRERLRKAIAASKAIRELAGNPLLLTMMAILNRNQELPRDREELYSQASRLLLYHWDIERRLVDENLNPMAIDYRDKQAMLRRVAHKMQASEKGLAGNIIEARELEGILAEYLREIEVRDGRTVARLLIQQLRERNFILCSLGADYYAFVHRAFLAYFCAWAFVWEFKETRTLTFEALKEVFGQHWREEAWHEVLRLICGMLDARFVGEILQVLMEQEGEAEKFGNMFLAAECLSEVRERERIARTDEALRERVVSLVRYDLNSNDNSWNEDVKKVRAIRTQAVETVAAVWRDRPDTLPWLKQHATDANGDVRRAAMQALAQQYNLDFWMVFNDLKDLPMPRAVILTALPVEYEAIRNHLMELQEGVNPRGTVYERGKFIANEQIWEVGIAEFGAGNVGVAVEVERAIAYFQPNILFFVGIAGGTKDVAIGDVVVATDVYGYESGKVGEQFSTRPKVGKFAYALVQRAKSEAKKGKWLQRITNSPASPPRAFVAPIAAGEKVIASRQSDIFQFLRASYNDAVAVEMEGFGFLSAAFAYPNIKAIAIRGISDLIEGKNDDSIELEQVRQEKASHHASAFAFEMLSKLQMRDAQIQRRQRRNRLALLKKVKNEVVDRLAQSLHNGVLIDFSKEEQPHQVQHPWDVDIKVGIQQNEYLPPDERLIDFFDREAIAGKFLILGQPGAGKTTLLLELAEELVARALSDPDYPMPILLNLSSWKDKNQSIAQWLIAEFRYKYGVREDIGRKWLSNQKLLPLLDGLDELVSSELQERCVRAINHFLASEEQPSHLVVCSRARAYESCETRLQLNGALYLHPLNEHQIRDYLVKIGNTNLLEIINSNSLFLDLIKMPLFLTIATLAYSEMSPERLQSSKSSEEFFNDLPRACIHRMLARNIYSRAYSKQNLPTNQQTYTWLTYLAKKLNKNAQIEFSIEQLFSSIEHIQMYQKGYMPWNYSQFLNYATELLILVRIGKGYRFIHRLLQDYFASLSLPGEEDI